MYERNTTGHGIKQPEQQQRGHSLIIVNDPGGGRGVHAHSYGRCVLLSQSNYVLLQRPHRGHSL